MQSIMLTKNGISPTVSTAEVRVIFKPPPHDVFGIEPTPSRGHAEVPDLARNVGAALDGDRWLFARQDTVEAAWQVVDPGARRRHARAPYASGSWGRGAASRLLPDRDRWYDPAG